SAPSLRPGRERRDGPLVDLGVALTTFALIFPVELPDKTFVASVVLATRFPPLSAWAGSAVAFLLQCGVAVLAGQALALLPRAPMLAVAAALFAAGAVVLWRGKACDVDASPERDAARPGRRERLKAGLTSFGVLFTAEWGDLSQLLTAGLVVRFEDPVSVFAGSWCSLVAVAGLAVLLGRTLTRYVSLLVVRRIGGTVCAVLAVVTGLTLAGVPLPL
ncbi:MAG: TMEM165/GDT1 family protein, partial [Streptomycetales bacterium]